MTLKDAYGKDIFVGDIILYPVIQIGYNGPEAIFVEFVVVSVDEIAWTKEYCGKFGIEFDPNRPPILRLGVLEATDEETLNDPDDMYRMYLSDPSKAIGINGHDLSRRKQTVKRDRKGYWLRPSHGRRKKKAAA